jgi:hypothetical protein
MFGTRKTWDLGDAPCLQELWKKDLSLDGESLSLLSLTLAHAEEGGPQQEPVWQHVRIVTDKEELEAERRGGGAVCVSHAAGLRERGMVK